MKISGPYFYPDEAPPATDTGGSDVDLLNSVDADSETPASEPATSGDESEEAEQVEGDVDLLGEDDDETDETAEETEEETQDETEETPEADKDIEQLVDGKVDLKKVKEKYPKLFKDFPALRENFFKGVNYDRIFGSIDAAEIASSKAENYDLLESAFVNDGDPSIVFKELSENNPKALNKVLDNWLPKLLEMDEDLYIRASRPALDRLIATAHRVGKSRYNRNNNDKAAANLMYAAEHIANFIYGSPDIPDLKDGKKEPDPEREEFEKEKNQYRSQKFNDFDGAIHESVRTTLKTKIGNSLPKNLPKLVRDTIVDKTMEGIDDKLGQDKAYLNGIRSLYQAGIRGGYPKESQAKIVNAYLARANSVVNPIRNRYLKEAGYESPSANGGETEPKLKRNISGKSGNRSDGGQNRRAPDAKQVDWRKTSDMDLLNDKVTLRK